MGMMQVDMQIGRLIAMLKSIRVDGAGNRVFQAARPTMLCQIRYSKTPCL